MSLCAGRFRPERRARTGLIRTGDLHALPNSRDDRDSGRRQRGNGPGAATSHVATATKATPATGSTPMTKATTTTAASGDKAAMSKACSEQANAKGLHGKERKKFRSACKHGKA